MRKAKRLCKQCGNIFVGDADSLLCPSCAKVSRANTVRTRICVDCGRSFEGGPRAKRCPECRKIALREYNKRFKQVGPQRTLGSLDICSMCGKSYVVVGGRQKYCPECQREALLNWQREHKKEYNKLPECLAKVHNRRHQRQKICEYCLKPFWSPAPSNYCSDHCREQGRKFRQCEADIRRGYNRDIGKYIKIRTEYREKVKGGP